MAESATKLPIKTEKPAAPAQQAQWAPFESLKREIDRLFDDFHPFGWHLPAARRPFNFDLPRLSDVGLRVAPAIDLAEREKEYEITAELPGLAEKDVEIRLSNRTLTIKGEKKEQREEKQKDYYLSERRFGSFHRSFQLPDGVDTDKIEATFAKGVLTIKLPKTTEAQKAEKTVAIKAA
jgi:HSP20 family protein